MTKIPERFNEAVDSFCEFLAESGHRGNVVWVFGDDLTSRRTVTWVRWPIAENNVNKARQLYDSLKCGSGLRFDALCRVDALICATISGPRADDGATGRFINGFTLSVATPLREARAVRSRLRWRWLLWQNGDPAKSGTAAFIHADT